jgi:hypothetical protein
MSKILKRPMFRKGGYADISANGGIMKIANPRSNFEGGGGATPDPYDTEFLRQKALYEKALGPGRDTKQDLYDMLISGGLNLAGGVGAGDGTLASIARSFKQPAEQFLAKRPEEEQFQRQIRLAAAQGAISQGQAERLARIKATQQATSRLPGDPKEARLRIIHDDAKSWQNRSGMVPGVAKTIAAFEFDVKNGNISGVSGEQIDSSKPFIRSGDINKSGKLSKNAELDYYDAGNIYVEPSSGIIFRFDGPEQGFKAVARTEVYRN